MTQGWGDEDLTTPPPGWGDEPLEVTAADEAHAKAVGEKLVALAGGDPSTQDAQPLDHEVETIGVDLVYDVQPARVYSAEQLPQLLASDVSLVVRDWTNPDEVGPFASKLKAGVLDVVQQGHARLAEKRPAGKAVTDATVAPELAFLGQTAATLKAVAGAILEGEKEARAIAGDVLLDVRGGEERVRTGTVSARVSDQHGGMKVTRTQATETVVDTAKVVDVLVATLLADQEEQEGAAGREPSWAGYYAAGVREGIEALLRLTSKPEWKVTALRAQVQLLEQQQRDALALRLEQTIGSKPKGNPQVKIERTEVKA